MVSQVPPALSRGPFTRRQGLAVVTADRLRGPAFRSLGRGVYCAAGREVSHLDRIVAARQVISSEAVLGGISALWAHGVQVADPDAPAELVLPPGVRARNREHIRLRRDLLLPDEIVTLALGLTTSPARTAFDLARSGIPYDVVPLLDALVAATDVRRDQVEAVASAHPGARWMSRLAPALDLVDGGAESIRESQLRIVLAEAGFPRPRTRFVIETSTGRFVARVDLAWPEFRIVIEYDGAYHDERGQVIRDRARLNAIRQAGWTALVIDAAQFARRDPMLAMIRAVFANAGWR